MKIIRSGLRYALATPSPHDVMVPPMSGMPIELVGSA